MSENIRSIAIVGDGVMPWLAAATLSRVLAPQRVAITVLERGLSVAAPDLATLPSLALLHRAIGVDEAAFMRATGATFKFGTEFAGWSGDGSSHFHAHGQLGAAIEGIPFHLWWLKQADAPLDAFSLSAVAARQSRFALPAADQRSVLSTLDYGYSLDTARYTQFLRAHSGVPAVQGEIADFVRQAETGFVTSLLLKDGRRVEADLFVDCTGRVADAFDSGFEDWSAWFACDRILHVRSEAAGAPPPYTRVMAKPFGWQWRLALQGVRGNGLVYSSRHMSDETAKTELLSSLDSPAAGEPKLMAFRPGRRADAWKANVIALGHAAGAFEPLEWTALHLAQSALLRLTTMFPDRRCHDAERTEFNRLTASEWDRARDFVLLHYAVAARSDTPFWRERPELPEPLRRKIEMFENRGHVILYDDETFDTGSWASVFLGQGVRPRRLDPLVALADAEAVSANLQRMRAIIRQAADAMQPHAAVLQRIGGAS